MGEEPQVAKAVHKTETCLESRYIRCDLTEAERSEATKELSRAIDAKDRADQEKAAVAADMKSRIERAIADIGRWNRTVRDGYEMRNVDCQVVYDFTEGVVRTVRTDSGEELESRKMRQEERQRQADIFDPEPEPEGVEGPQAPEPQQGNE